MNFYNLNSVQQTMVSGSHKAECIELTADCCLWYPACMWRGRNVRLVIEGDEEVPKLRYRSSSASIFWGLGDGDSSAESAIALPYIVASLVAAPFLALGSCLKNFALIVDPKASAYNQLAAKHLSELGDMSEVGPSLREGYFYLPHDHSARYRKDLELTLEIERQDLKDKEELLLIANDDIKKYALEDLKPFLGQNKKLLMVDEPFFHKDFTTDYKISTCSFSEKEIFTIYSTLLKEIKSHHEEIATLEEKLSAITRKQEFQKKSEKFLKDAMILMNNENEYSLI
ncbi:MAG: hypothetical protein H0W50_00325 [Parachlamydiaceae bacterium]|nr:hypothetical protein [Parachlamydiaceae bacterium]